MDTSRYWGTKRMAATHNPKRSGRSMNKKQSRQGGANTANRRTVLESIAVKPRPFVIGLIASAIQPQAVRNDSAFPIENNPAQTAIMAMGMRKSKNKPMTAWPSRGAFPSAGGSVFPRATNMHPRAMAMGYSKAWGNSSGARMALKRPPRTPPKEIQRK